MNKKVLIVDDEENIVELLKFNMELKGYEVEYAYDGEEALKKAKDIKPALILLDLMLPIMDGTKVCSKIREDEELKDTPIIMLTAKNMEKDKIYGLELGADDYITKPFSIKELMARVKAVTRRYAAPSQPIMDTSLEIGELYIDMENYEVFKREEDVEWKNKKEKFH